MKILLIKIIFLISLELVLSRGAKNRKNEISADVDNILRIIGTVLEVKIDEEGKTLKINDVSCFFTSLESKST
jgi:hypothetical protein